MKKPKFFVISYAIYPFDLLVAIGATHKQVIDFLESKLGTELDKEDSNGLEMEGSGRTSMLEGGQTVMQLKPFKNTPHWHATLTHEAFHCVEFLFNRIDVKHHIDSSETFAYLIEFIVERVLETVKK